MICTYDVPDGISSSVMLCCTAFMYSVDCTSSCTDTYPRTYVQALECEHTVEYMAGLFPQEFASEALLYIHRSALNLEHLVMKLQHHFEPLSKEVFGDK